MKCYSMPTAFAVLAPATFAATIQHSARQASSSLQPAQSLEGTWEYVDCYGDNPAKRVLHGASFSDGVAMTGEACVNFCGARGYNWAGTQFSQECYCGIGLGAAQSYPDDCNMVCSGNFEEVCGGPSRLTVYKSSQSGPKTSDGANGYVYAGCFSDSVNNRTLTHRYDVSGGVSVESCTAVCNSQGYQFSGVEFSTECYCDNSISNLSKPIVGSDPSATGCDYICQANTTEYCGGAERVSIYKKMS